MTVKNTASEGLKKRGEQMIAAISAAIKKLSFKLQARVKAKKLSGQVLNVRTGRLRRSINVEMSDDGLVGTVGTNVEYAAAHEFGISKDEQVRAHLRTIKEAWGRPLAEAKQIQVSAHTRKVNLPARSFMRSSLEEMKPEMMGDIKVAVSVKGQNVQP